MLEGTSLRVVGADLACASVFRSEHTARQNDDGADDEASMRTYEVEKVEHQRRVRPCAGGSKCPSALPVVSLSRFCDLIPVSEENEWFPVGL